VTDGHLAIERIAGAPVKERHLAGMIEAGQGEHVLDVRLFRSVEHRRRDRYAMAQIGAELEQAFLVERLDGLLVAIDLAQQFLERLEVLLALIELDGVADLQPEAGAGPAEMGFEDLPDIHPARHAKRIEN